MDSLHIPVLLKETIEALNIDPHGLYVDGTLGRGGHSRAILEKLTDGRLIAIDRDQTAIDDCRRRLCEFNDKITYVHGNFRDIKSILNDAGDAQVDGMLFDLGVSSPQLDEAERGFSYMHDAPLDMRMDKTAAVTAKDVVNTWPEDELRRIFFEYGEERYATRIAAGIVRRRKEAPIETTFELVDAIKSSMPAQALREKQHPAKRTFQAIRIEVNSELDVLEESLERMIDILSDGGRLCVITFHSLEDRIVKNIFRKNENPCTCPPEFPVCVCGKKSKGVCVNRHPILPSEEEVRKNNRSHSAKLRVFERRFIK